MSHAVTYPKSHDFRRHIQDMFGGNAAPILSSDLAGGNCVRRGFMQQVESSVHPVVYLRKRQLFGMPIEHDVGGSSALSGGDGKALVLIPH